MRENADQNNSEYRHFLRSDCAKLKLQISFGTKIRSMEGISIVRNEGNIEKEILNLKGFSKLECSNYVYQRKFEYF